MFKKLYNRVLIWAEHPFAVRSLMGLSFIEAFIFPIPPDIMLAPMTMAKPDKAWKYAFLTTLCSVIGGVIGYILGYWAAHLIAPPFFDMIGKGDSYHQMLAWFDNCDAWVIFVTAFIPMPFKIFTIAAGAMQINFIVFLLAAILARSVRFFLVCGIFKTGNKYFAEWISKWIDVVGWTTVILLFIIGVYLLI